MNPGIDDDTQEGIKIMAIGDMNNDKHSDIVSVNGHQDEFTVHYYDPDSMSYYVSAPCAVDPLTNSNVNKIASIVISRDMNELQSLFIIYYKRETQNDKRTYIKVFK